MNKYEDLWFKTEGGNIKNQKLKYSLKFYKYTLSKGGIKLTRMLYKILRFSVPVKMLGYFSLFPSELKEWAKANILNNLNKEKVINIFIQTINNTITENNEIARKLYINSFKDLDIIKDIKIDNENIINIILKNGDEYKMKYLLKNIDEMKDSVNKCHKICYEYFKKNINSNADVVFTMEKDLFNRIAYHSFIVRNDLVFDYARNIVMGYENYKKIFKPKIVFKVSGEEALKEIDYLEKNDNDFKELDNWYPVLKYGLYRVSNKNIKSI